MSASDHPGAGASDPVANDTSDVSPPALGREVIWDEDGRVADGVLTARAASPGQAEQAGDVRHASRTMPGRRHHHGTRLLVAALAIAAVLGAGRALQRRADRAARSAAGAVGTPAPPTTTDGGLPSAATPPTAAASPATSAPTASTATTTASTATTTAAGSSTVTASTPVAAPTTSGTGPSAPPLPSVGPADPPLVRYLRPVRWALVSEGTLYLRGRVPDAATAEQTASRAASVSDGGNVVVDLTIDPTATASVTTPLFFADAVHFVEGSDVVTVEEQFLPELARILLERHPGATIRLFANADTSTDADLMVRRAVACADFIRRFGLDAKRISITTRGDAGGSTGATRPGPSIELALDGLLDG